MDPERERGNPPREPQWQIEAVANSSSKQQKSNPRITSDQLIEDFESEQEYVQSENKTDPELENCASNLTEEDRTNEDEDHDEQNQSSDSITDYVELENDSQ